MQKLSTYSLYQVSLESIEHKCRVMEKKSNSMFFLSIN